MGLVLLTGFARAVSCLRRFVEGAEGVWFVPW